jgi:hypothetical protein
MKQQLVDKSKSRFRNVSKRAFGPRKHMKNHTRRSRLFNGLAWFFDPGFSWILFDGKPVSYWKVIMSVRLSVGAWGFKGWFVMLPLR